MLSRGGYAQEVSVGGTRRGGCTGAGVLNTRGDWCRRFSTLHEEVAQGGARTVMLVCKNSNETYLSGRVEMTTYDFV